MTEEVKRRLLGMRFPGVLGIGECPGGMLRGTLQYLTPRTNPTGLLWGKCKNLWMPGVLKHSFCKCLREARAGPFL